MRFIYLCIWLILAKTRQDCNRIRESIFVYSSFPFLLHSFDAFRLLSVESSRIALFTFQIWFRFFHPWCPFVWVIFCFSSRTKKNLWAILLFTGLCFIISFLDIFSFWEILTLEPFGFNLWHGIILNTIHLSVLLPFCGSFVARFLGQILMRSG